MTGNKNTHETAASAKKKNSHAKTDGTKQPSKLRTALFILVPLLAIIVGVVVGLFVFGQHIIFPDSKSTTLAVDDGATEQRMKPFTAAVGHTKDQTNPATKSLGYSAIISPPVTNTYPYTNAPVVFPTNPAPFSASVGAVTVRSVKTLMSNSDCAFGSPSNPTLTGFQLTINSCGGVTAPEYGIPIGFKAGVTGYFSDPVAVFTLGTVPAVAYRSTENKQAYCVCIAYDAEGLTWRTPFTFKAINYSTAGLSAMAGIVLPNGNPALVYGVSSVIAEVIISTTGHSFSRYNQFTLFTGGVASQFLTSPLSIMIQPSGRPLIAAFGCNILPATNVNATGGAMDVYSANVNNPTSASDFTAVTFINVGGGGVLVNSSVAVPNTFGYVCTVQSRLTNLYFSTNAFDTITTTNGFTVGATTLTLSGITVLNRAPLRLVFVNGLPVIIFMGLVGTSITQGQLYYWPATAYSKITYTTGTVSQSSTTVTALGGTFTTAMIGGVITFSSGGAPTCITAVPTSTTLTVATSQTVPPGTTFTINYFPVTFAATPTLLDAGISQTMFDAVTLPSGKSAISAVTSTGRLRYSLMDTGTIVSSFVGSSTKLANSIGISHLNGGPVIAYQLNASYPKIFYDTGTITSTNGSGTVTGSGTSWTSAMVGMSLFGVVNGVAVVYGTITAVASATSLTTSIFGGAQTNIAYTIYPFWTLDTYPNRSGTAQASQNGTATVALTESGQLTLMEIGLQFFHNTKANGAVYAGQITAISDPNLSVSNTSLTQSNAFYAVLQPMMTAMYMQGTAAQTQFTITGTNTNFTSALLGQGVWYLHGVFGGVISAVTSTTQMTVSMQQTVNAGALFCVFTMSNPVHVVMAGANNETLSDSLRITYSASGV